MSLYYNGQWGTVCDDSWDIADAHVVCRMLGYPRAIGFTIASHFGGAMGGPIWLDEVNCRGTENTLAACPHGGWNMSDCDHTKDAGVICDHNYTANAKGEVHSVPRCISHFHNAYPLPGYTPGVNIFENKLSDAPRRGLIFWAYLHSNDNIFRPS